MPVKKMLLGGDDTILIHYGGRGFDINDDKREWCYVNGKSHGCQVICLSHHFSHDGRLDIQRSLSELTPFKKKTGETLGSY